MLRLDRVPTPIGTLTVIAAEAAVRAIAFDEAWLIRHFHGQTFVEEQDPLGDCSKLRAWFEGDPGALEDLPIEPEGTPFQQRVWAALRELPAGRTTTYGRLAASLGMPTATRAVGLANGSNPI